MLNHTSHSADYINPNFYSFSMTLREVSEMRYGETEENKLNYQVMRYNELISNELKRQNHEVKSEIGGDNFIEKCGDVKFMSVVETTTSNNSTVNRNSEISREENIMKGNEMGL